MPAGVRGRPPAGPHWRCSMSITRCGSARSSVIWTISRQPHRRAAGLLGGCPGRDARAAGSCPPIGPIRWSPITAAPVWRWTGRRSCSSRCAGGPRAQRDQLHGDPGRPGGAAVQGQRQQRCGGGVPDRRARAIPRSMSWWGFSSTPWCCGSIWPGIPPFAELLAQVRAAQPGRLRAPRRAL